MRRAAAVILAVFALAFAVPSPAAGPMVAAHRGGALLWPENSLLAFRNALALGVDFLETDVHLTADGEVVVLHDPTLDRTTTAQGAVRDVKLPDLVGVRLKAADGTVTTEHVPTLRELLDLLRPSSARLLLEIKVGPGRQPYAGIEEKVLAQVRDAGLFDRVLLMAFEDDTLRRVRTLDPRVRTTLLVSLRRAERASPRDIVRWATAVGANDLGIDHRALNAEIVAAARAARVRVAAWTVNEEADIRRVIGLGADVVISDRPDLVRGALSGSGGVSDSPPHAPHDTTSPMTSRYVLALDQGTSGSTALLVDGDGRVGARGYAELPQHYPQPGWVEHDPEEIWATTVTAARSALAAAGASGADVAAIGITNQRETTIVWDRASGQPIHRAIVWQCRRTAALCDELKAAGLESVVRERTGLVLDAYFSGTKIRWLLDTVPDAERRAEDGDLAFGTVDSWLVWKLTGGRVHVTDVTNASRTLCLNLDTVDWDDDMLKALRVPRAMLPRLVPSSGVVAETVDLGWLPAGVPIAGIAGDQHAALFGQACYARGSAKNTYGTGCFLLLNTGATPVRSRSGLLTTLAWKIGETTTYALEGSVFIAGAALQWLRDGLGLIARAADSEGLATAVRDTGGVYFVPAFVGLGAPYWDMYARGTIVGLTRGTSRAHLVRAALEAIAYQSRDVLEAMATDAGVAVGALRVDGGASANDFLCQFQADVLGATVLRPAVIETTALGAAYLAGLGVGRWPSLDVLAGRWTVERTFTPTMDARRRDALYDGWRRAVERARGHAPSQGE